MRVGIGYDVHTLITGRRLVLGGVEIPFEQGLAGHSDADVLCHAIMDALLGATSLGDIGQYFPPDDPKYKDASSLGLLRQVGELIAKHGWRAANLDATIVAERPKLAGHIPQMRQLIAHSLNIDSEKVGVKATTTEGLGFAGRGEGIAAYAVALVERL
ncbi:MAG TPA: 2-C-methyl-D-erythritol 2,4-cyclodiphosphate synthase [Dehalococcoidia bacterium]|jgi:2-C-methyl-D-erythritol 2,4-cyclodiphosphate synthase|nr:2-C-methyl-D-erythritol 2,4-cyclodiphosphate synthase [Dehalococcoidia bacterium]